MLPTLRRHLHTVLHTVKGIIRPIRWTIQPPPASRPARRAARNRSLSGDPVSQVPAPRWPRARVSEPSVQRRSAAATAHSGAVPRPHRGVDPTGGVGPRRAGLDGRAAQGWPGAGRFVEMHHHEGTKQKDGIGQGASSRSCLYNDGAVLSLIHSLEKELTEFVHCTKAHRPKVVTEGYI